MTRCVSCDTPLNNPHKGPDYLFGFCPRCHAIRFGVEGQGARTEGINAPPVPLKPEPPQPEKLD